MLSASDEPGGALGIELTTEPQGAYMIWLPAGGAKSPPSAETIARGEHYIRMEGTRDLPLRDADARVDGARPPSARRGSQPDDVDLFIPHQANIRIIEAVAKGLNLPMDRMFVNLDKYGNTSAASVPIALAEAVNEGRVAVGDNIVIVAFGAGFTSRRGRRSSGPPTRPAASPATPPSGPRTSTFGCRSTGIRSTRSRRPSPRSMARPRPGVDPPLDDVVPGEPEPAAQPVR